MSPGEKAGSVALLRSNALAPLALIFPTAGASLDTGIVYSIPFPRAVGARRG
jgi:hypothetical protein